MWFVIILNIFSTLSSFQLQYGGVDIAPCVLRTRHCLFHYNRQARFTVCLITTRWLFVKLIVSCTLQFTKQLSCHQTKITYIIFLLLNYDSNADVDLPGLRLNSWVSVCSSDEHSHFPVQSCSLAYRITFTYLSFSRTLSG